MPFSVSTADAVHRDRSILIAEDHVDSRDALKTLLEACGYHVLLASNGQEAIEMAGARGPALILMDMMMPELDGFEAIRRLRHQPRTRRTPIIALTAMEGARQLSLGAGANAFVAKPVDTATLLTTIRGLLRRDGENGDAAVG